ncbi:MAG TPA: ABC transporter substrate-binding protein [Alphaproteobacteria bacterium]|nr:ABC transporter substrate-binding protein [Alphaproteobacteria bacterium]
MKRNSGVQHKISTLVSSVLVALVALAMIAPATWAGEATVQRLIFASAGADESNRFWALSRPHQLQNDPYLETLLDLDPKTSEFTPRLAEKWEASPDMKEWTLSLRKGVPFHFGFGEFTARDVVHSHALMLRPETIATFVGFWRTVEEVKVIDDYTVVFRMKSPATTMPYALSRAGDLRMVSKAQWDQDGLEGFEQRPAGTGIYQYGGRQLGRSIWFERVEKHWSGIRPDFKELEIRLVPEDSTRLAMLVRGEAHAGDLSRELHADAEKRGLKVMAASLAAEWVSVYFGGMYFTTGDPKFNPNVPWSDKRVRQAMNMAINRQELQKHLFRGKGEPMYVSGLAPFLEGYNPEWAQRFEQLYGYNPTRARQLLKEAGYAPGTLKAKIWSFAQLAKPEIPQLAEAVVVYFQDVGIEATLETIDVAHLNRITRAKENTCCIWPNMIALRPTEEMVRIAHTKGANAHLFESDFLEKKYAELAQTVDPQARQRVAREITDYLFEEFTSIPLITVAHEVVVNPKVIGEWTWPGQGAGRTTHFHLIKAAR